MRILLVDDNAQVRVAIRSILLTDPSLEVVGEATCGTEAVHFARTLQPDLILLDVGLPDINGIEVARILVQVAPKVVIVFVSQHSSMEIVKSTLSTGATGYVLKTDVASDLLPAIAAAANGQKYLSEQLRGLDSSP